MCDASVLFNGIVERNGLERVSSFCVLVSLQSKFGCKSIAVSLSSFDLSWFYTLFIQLAMEAVSGEWTVKASRVLHKRRGSVT